MPKRPFSSPDESLDTLQKPKVTPPRLYRVILHNDDYTTMDFVIDILMSIFRKEYAEAYLLMMHVHHKGRAIAGLYTREVAETKVQAVSDYARREGHPLLVTMEPDE